MIVGVIVFFFFKQKPAYGMRISDGSSDVCSSDRFGQYGMLDPAGQAPGGEDVDQAGLALAEVGGREAGVRRLCAAAFQRRQREFRRRLVEQGGGQPPRVAPKADHQVGGHAEKDGDRQEEGEAPQSHRRLPESGGAGRGPTLRRRRGGRSRSSIAAVRSCERRLRSVPTSSAASIAAGGA